MRELNAYLDGQLVGTFAMSDGGAVAFEYVDGYEHGNTPISLSMPIISRRHRNAVTTAWLDGLLADRESAREAIGREHHVSARSPFRLLEHVGRDVAGAVQLIPRGEAPDDSAARPPSGDRADGDAIASALRSVKATYESGAPHRSEHFRLSLAGAQPKIALGRDELGWYFPDRHTASTYILKPETDVNEHIDSLDIAERITMLAAERVGLAVARSEGWLSPDGSLRALALRRYDRTVDESGHIHRLHQEDLLQALGLPTSKKYQDRDRGPGVGQVAKLLRLSLSPSDREAAALGFFRGIVFNVAVLGTDAHAKNYSLLLDGRGARLAPLYDLVSTAGYADREDATRRSAMSIGGEYAFHSIGEEQLLKEAARLRLDADLARLTISDIVTPLADAFSDAAKHLQGEGLEHPLLVRTVDGVATKSNLVRMHQSRPRPTSAPDHA